MTNLKKERLDEQANRRKVMVVDDDEFSLLLISSALKNDYDVKLVSQGAQAFEAALDFTPDLIVLDLNMPNVDGFEILNQFRDHIFLSSIPILCLSGEKSLDTRRLTREFGATAFLTKPVQKSQIKSDIELLLRNSNMQISSEDGKENYFISYNVREKEFVIRNQIRTWINNNEKVVLLSFTDGESFCKLEELEHIKKEQLYHLQIKGNILSKLAYMDDLSVIAYDLEEILGGNIKHFNLVVDEPEILLNLYEESSSKGHIFLFNELLKRKFSKISYFSKKSSNQDFSEKLNRLANTLTGNI